MLNNSDSNQAGLLQALSDVVGGQNLLMDDASLENYNVDWTGKYSGTSLAVIRPANTQEVAKAVQICNVHKVAIVPQGGNTGVCGGATPSESGNSIVLSLERMKSVRNVDPIARTAIVEAGVVLETFQNLVAEHDLSFPLMFGARGSAQIGGCLSTNAGGSNVLRFGNARELCFGVEAVLPDGTIITELSGLRKNNTGYDLSKLLIGAEGTLGIITAASLKLFPRNRVCATAFLSLPTLHKAVMVLNRVQDACGGLVEAFEYLPDRTIDLICKHAADTRRPFTEPANNTILLEIASPMADDAATNSEGTVALEERLQNVLMSLFESGDLLDANIATSEQNRNDFWHLRESVLESILANGPAYQADISLPLEKTAELVEHMDQFMKHCGFVSYTVGHLGDGNLHLSIAPIEGGTINAEAIKPVLDETFSLLARFGGSFSAEHGIGQSKLDLFMGMKEKSQIAAMNSIKNALDPNGIMNPGKLLAPLPGCKNGEMATTNIGQSS